MPGEVVLQTCLLTREILTPADLAVSLGKSKKATPVSASSRKTVCELCQAVLYFFKNLT